MKNIFFFLLAAIPFFFTACNDDEVPTPDDELGRVEVNFVTNYGDSDLYMFQDMTYPASENTFRFKKIQFYVSEMVLLKEGTSDVTELSEIELIDFSNIDNAADAALGTARAYEEIPVGEYSGIRFGLGVERDLNTANNGEYASSDPLGQNWWAGWESYIFAKFEGNVSTDGDTEYDGEDDVVFTLHTGGNEAYRSVTLNTPFTVTADGSNILKIAIDAEKVFRSESGTIYDIITYNQAHTANSAENIKDIMDNFENALSVE